jgi:hypothetical protein
MIPVVRPAFATPLLAYSILYPSYFIFGFPLVLIVLHPKKPDGALVYQLSTKKEKGGLDVNLTPQSANDIQFTFYFLRPFDD